MWIRRTSPHDIVRFMQHLDILTYSHRPVILSYGVILFFYEVSVRVRHAIEYNDRYIIFFVPYHFDTRLSRYIP